MASPRCRRILDSCDARWEIAAKTTGGAPIIEEWTAWFLVREREREYARQARLRDAEQIRTKAEQAKVLTLPPKARPHVERPPRRRRAA